MSTGWKILFAILLFFIALGTCATAFETLVMNMTTSTVMFPDGQHSWWDPRSTPQDPHQDAEPLPPQEPAPEIPAPKEDHQRGDA